MLYIRDNLKNTELAMLVSYDNVEAWNRIITVDIIICQLAGLTKLYWKDGDWDYG